DTSAIPDYLGVPEDPAGRALQPWHGLAPPAAEGYNAPDCALMFRHIGQSVDRWYGRPTDSPYRVAAPAALRWLQSIFGPVGALPVLQLRRPRKVAEHC